jgi:gamma-glutamylputrescine oxidase
VNTTSYWLVQPLPEVPVGSLTSPVDVVVVGGGVTGCSCALALARGGKRVRLLEAREIAGGASGRNGGFALRGLALGYDTARETLGVEAARASWELTEQGLDAMESLAGDAFRRVGSLRLADDRLERDELQREYEALREDGFEAQWLDPLPEILRRRFAGAFVHPGDGALDPARWVRRLAARASAAGAEIVQGHPVDREAIDALEADAVVIAVDGMTDSLVRELSGSVVPARGQVIATEPLPERLYDRPHYSRGGYDYWQQLGDGTLILGGRRDTSLQTEHTAVEETTPFIQDQLESFAAELVGRPVPIAQRWAGIWGQTFDLLPLVGRVPGSDRLWVAGGYSGHGNVLGLVCGDLVAKAILGGPTPELELFDPARVPASGRTTGSASADP